MRFASAGMCCKDRRLQSPARQFQTTVSGFAGFGTGVVDYYRLMRIGGDDR